MSYEADAIVWPSGEKADGINPMAMPLERLPRCAGRCIPEPYCLIARSRCDRLAVGREGDGTNTPAMPFERLPRVCRSLHPRAVLSYRPKPMRSSGRRARRRRH